MKTDYPELEGKIVTVHGPNRAVVELLVVGVNYHIGITMVNARNTTNRIVCLNKTEHYSQAHYRKIFHYVVKIIQRGSMEAGQIMRYDRNLRGIPVNAIHGSLPQCPFMQ